MTLILGAALVLPPATSSVFAQAAAKVTKPSGAKRATAKPTATKPAAARPATATAPTAAPTAKWNYLDDEAEAGGYDVTAQVAGTGELLLAENDDHEGYVLKIGSGTLELGTQIKGQYHALASVREKLVTGPIVLQRRGPRWRVLSANRTVLQAEDDRFDEGKIGWRGSLSNVRVQPVEEISFADDFMRDAKAVKVSDAATTETIWRAVAGTWSTSGLTENSEAQVAQSTNPFVFKTNGVGTHLALGGQGFWSDYTFEVSVKPEGASAIGMAALAQDEKNYLLFAWPQGGAPELRAIVNGQSRVLDRAPDYPGFEQKQWYRLRLSVAGGTLRAWIDDAEVLRAQTGLFGRGAAGLWAQTPSKEGAAAFDDVLVRSEDDFHDDFSTPVPGRWQTVSGKWGWRGAAAPVGAQGAFAVMGEKTWKDYVVSTDAFVPADGGAGLVLHHIPGKGALWLRWAGSKSKLPYAGHAQIVRLTGGKANVLGDTAIGGRFDNKTTSWRFGDERGYLKAEANGTRIVDAFSDEDSEGRAGLSAQNASAKSVVRLSNFAVEFPQVRPTWAKVPDLYEEEKQAQTMGGWSTPQGFWLADGGKTGAAIEASTTPANANTTLWHKGRFWGDDSVSFPLPTLTPGQKLDILFTPPGTSSGKPNANDPAALKLTLSIDSGVLHALLARGGKTQSKGDMKLAGAPNDQVLEIERRGTYFIVRSGGKDEERKTLLAARVA